VTAAVLKMSDLVETGGQARTSFSWLGTDATGDGQRRPNDDGRQPSVCVGSVVPTDDSRDGRCGSRRQTTAPCDQYDVGRYVVALAGDDVTHDTVVGGERLVDVVVVVSAARMTQRAFFYRTTQLVTVDSTPATDESLGSRRLARVSMHTAGNQRVIGNNGEDQR